MLARAAAVDNFGAGRTLARMALATRSDDHSHPDLATKAEVDDKFSELQLEGTGLRADFMELRGDFMALRTEFAEHRAEQREALAELRADFTVLGGKVTTLEGEMARIREEMAEHREETVRLREEVAELRGSMKSFMWGIGIGFAAMFAGLGIIAALAS